MIQTGHKYKRFFGPSKSKVQHAKNQFYCSRLANGFKIMFHQKPRETIRRAAGQREREKTQATFANYEILFGNICGNLFAILQMFICPPSPQIEWANILNEIASTFATKGPKFISIMRVSFFQVIFRTLARKNICKNNCNKKVQKMQPLVDAARNFRRNFRPVKLVIIEILMNISLLVNCR
jgi:hypothetical protein